MGLFAHATHIHLPDQDTGRLVASALLKSPLGLVISKPYGKWINAYLPMGISYKDVKEFPTASCLELNCFDSEGLEIKLFKNDRLAFHFESGVSDAVEQEDRLLELAEELWQDEHPELVQQAREAQKQRAHELSNLETQIDDEPPAQANLAQVKDFWALTPEEQAPYLDRARTSSQFISFSEEITDADHLPDCEPLLDFLAPDYSRETLEQFLFILLKRHAPPSSESEKALASRLLGGKEHSTRAEDYLRGFATLFGVRGSLWTVDSLLTEKASAIDRRIISVEALEA
jgi:hypothetical protein